VAIARQLTSIAAEIAIKNIFPSDVFVALDITASCSIVAFISIVSHGFDIDCEINDRYQT
jgi:hypothetical protein